MLVFQKQLKSKHAGLLFFKLPILEDRPINKSRGVNSIIS